MVKRLGSMLCLLSIVVVPLSCYEETFTVMDGTGDDGASRLPIYGGGPATLPEHGAVVSLHVLYQHIPSGGGGWITAFYGTPFCSGTLITDSVVLTAAHCMTDSRGRGSRSPNSFAVYVGDTAFGDPIWHYYFVSEVQVYPTYDARRIRNDLALVRLSQPIAEAVEPVPALPASLGLTRADVGQRLNFAGFGITEDGTSGVKLAVDGVLAGFGCVFAGCPNGGDPATQISYTQAGGIGPCSGDSGGPAFFYRDSVPYVAGITSYGDSACTQYGVSTRADAFETFIDDFIADCSANGACNPECATGADPDCAIPCGNDQCDAGESCDGRSGTVACPGDCGSVNGLKPAQRYCYVGSLCEGPGCP